VGTVIGSNLRQSQDLERRSESIRSEHAPAASPDPLVIWAVGDGRAGIDNQVLGLAEAVARLVPAEIVQKRVGWNGFLDPLPAPLNPAPAWGLSSGSSRFEPPWPDLWIAAGRASLPLSIRMRRRSHGKTFVVQLQDPRLPAGWFDLVAPPRHDERSGDGVFAIIGSPHRITPDRLAEGYATFAARIDPLPHPRIGVLIGGRSKAFDIRPARAEILGDQLERMARSAGGSVLATFSRRTPAGARSIISRRLSGVPGWIWDGAGDNPYFAILAAADAFVVTEDSINMVAEAASTGKPIHIASVDGAQRRKRLFHADLAQRGVIRAFTGAFETWTYQPLRETERLAEAVVQRLSARAAASDAPMKPVVGFPVA
jgi:mitochondrial fission protein ELM1